MFTQDEIDAVLMDATTAVSTLSGDVDRLEKRGAPNKTQAPAAAASKARPESAVPQRSAVSPNSRIQRILGLKVTLNVRLAERSMLTSDILRIRPGTILDFDRTVEDELDLMIGTAQIGTGVAVKVGEHFGLRVAHIGNVRRRIELLSK
jgi:flagellar motor switch protein FliN/FliY